MYLLKAEEVHREMIERVHDLHADNCPVYQSIRVSIYITTDYEVDGD